MFVKSLYFKVALWYSLALIVIISIFGALIYQNFKHSLFGDLDNLLENKAENVEDLIDTAVKSAPISSPAFLQAIKSTIQEEQEDSPFVQIYDPQSKILAYSKKDMTGLVPVPKINRNITEGNINIETCKKVFLGGEKVDLRVLTMPVFRNSELAYIIQVDGLLAPTLVTLHKLKTVLYVFLPLALLFAISIGFFLTKVALNPIDRITRTMSQINTKNLQERINIPNPDNEIKLLVDTFNDMLLRLDRAFSVQKQFIQDISHELKTPLTALRGKQEVTMVKRRTAEEYESVLQVNLDEIERMSKLVENLLVLISIDSKEAFFKIETIDLAVVIRRTTANMMALIQQKEIKFNSSLQEDVFVKGDNSQLGRMVLNLLDNAIKYTAVQGQIDVKIYKEDDMARIVITNTGSGIAKDDLFRIFDRFYRTEKSRNSPGFGLGLSIVKSIVDLHEGTIKAESQVGQNTAFTVFIPLNLPQASQD